METGVCALPFLLYTIFFGEREASGGEKPKFPSIFNIFRIIILKNVVICRMEGGWIGLVEENRKSAVCTADGAFHHLFHSETHFFDKTG